VYHLLPNLWKASYTISASTSVDVQQWLPYSTNNRLSCVVTYPSQWFFHFGEKIIIAWTHIGWVWWLFQYLPSPAAKEIRDNIGSMSPCIFMKDDGIHCQQVLSLSPECWTKMITEEIAVVGSVYCLSLRDSVVQYQSMSYATINIAFTLLCVGRNFFGQGEPGCFHSFDCCFKHGSYERA